ncbi:hypothetical protein [Candidatus Ichthyocystis sparus]|nr:hypothetical protein [Candidatus Ichthyocystis sparus]
MFRIYYAALMQKATALDLKIKSLEESTGDIITYGQYYGSSVARRK